MAENRAAGLDDEGELQLGEALEEKLALADRFGLILGFHSFNQSTYLGIVGHYLDRAGVEDFDGDLREAALKWALARGSRSGRTARQFVDDAVDAWGWRRACLNPEGRIQKMGPGLPGSR